MQEKQLKFNEKPIKLLINLMIIGTDNAYDVWRDIKMKLVIQTNAIYS